MTKHKSQEERIDEILDAAAEEIASNGYSGLTMDAIIARTPLSKGGVYRFFSNKRDVALALLERILSRWGEVDVDEALSWGLPIDVTLLRVLAMMNMPGSREMRDRKVWVQLLPSLITDEEFRRVRQEQWTKGKQHYHLLIERLLEREGLTTTGQYEELFERVAVVGAIFWDGLTLHMATASELEDISGYLQDVMVKFIQEHLAQLTR